MAGREMSYLEFKERLQLCGHEGNAVVGLWNNLARYMVGFFSLRHGEPADCTLSINELQALSLKQVKALERVGKAQIAVFEALQRSIRLNPAELRDYQRDISRNGLMLFASGVARSRVGMAWKGLCSTLGDPEVLTIPDIEDFCAQVRSGKRPPRFTQTEQALLEAWLKHLKKVW